MVWTEGREASVRCNFIRGKSCRLHENRSSTTVLTNADITKAVPANLEAAAYAQQAEHAIGRDRQAAGLHGRQEDASAAHRRQ